MKLYKLTLRNDEKSRVKWVGTQADAANTRKTWVTAGAKRNDIDTEEVDVPTDKQGLLKFLNETGRA